MSSRRILNISLPEELYTEVSELAAKERKTKAELAREILQQQIIRKKHWEDIRKAGDDTAVRCNVRNEEDIESLIHEYREEAW